jgi:PAS domain S-box-containing protein
VSAPLDESAEDLYENAPCGYLSAAPDGTIIRVNGTFLRWTGYSREELVGVRRFQGLLSVGGRIYHETHYAPLLRMQGTVREIAVDMVRADGTRLPALVNSVQVTDEHGEPRLVRTAVFPANERKRYEAELLAARDRERVLRERTQLLQRITAALAAAPDAEAVAAAAVAELVAAFGADRAGVAVPVAPGEEELRVLSAHGSGDVARPAGVDAFDEGEPGHRGAAVLLSLGRAYGGDGRLWLEFATPRPFEPDERALLAACAVQTGQALERARLHQETADVALSLQRSLLAGAPPRDPRFEVATLYHAAGEHLEVGGDWYDAFTLPGGNVGIVVGDVVGRGLHAASAMGQLRSAIRALAGAELQPGAVLSHLDTFVEQVDAARYATVACAEVDPDSGRVVAAVAGHPPPLLIGPDGGAELMMEGRSPPLGVLDPGTPRPETSFELAPGGGFLLYTDGLVERRAEPIDVGLERLLAAVRGSEVSQPGALVERLPSMLLGPGGHDDDVCVLGFRRASGV